MNLSNYATRECGCGGSRATGCHRMAPVATNQKQYDTPEKRITKLIEHYESQSKLFPAGDIRGPMMAQAANDMREALTGDYAFLRGIANSQPHLDS